MIIEVWLIYFVTELHFEVIAQELIIKSLLECDMTNYVSHQLFITYSCTLYVTQAKYFIVTDIYINIMCLTLYMPLADQLSAPLILRLILHSQQFTVFTTINHLVSIDRSGTRSSLKLTRKVTSVRCFCFPAVILNSLVRKNHHTCIHHVCNAFETLQLVLNTIIKIPCRSVSQGQLGIDSSENCKVIVTWFLHFQVCMLMKGAIMLNLVGFLFQVLVTLKGNPLNMVTIIMISHDHLVQILSSYIITYWQIQ